MEPKSRQIEPLWIRATTFEVPEPVVSGKPARVVYVLRGATGLAVPMPMLVPQLMLAAAKVEAQFEVEETFAVVANI